MKEAVPNPKGTMKKGVMILSFANILISPLSFKLTYEKQSVENKGKSGPKRVYKRTIGIVFILNYINLFWQGEGQG